MSNRSQGIIKIGTLMPSNIESELKSDMCLKLSGLGLKNSSLGTLGFNRFRLCSRKDAWSLEGLLDVNYPLAGWFTIISSVVSYPIRDINSFLLKSYDDVETYCSHLFDICKSHRFIGVIEVTPAITLFSSNIFGE